MIVQLRLTYVSIHSMICYFKFMGAFRIRIGISVNCIITEVLAIEFVIFLVNLEIFNSV